MAAADIPTLRWGIVATGLISSWFAADIIREDRPNPAPATSSRPSAPRRAKGPGLCRQAHPPGIAHRLRQLRGGLRGPGRGRRLHRHPHAFHKQNCLDAIAHGKNVLCEKAFALNAAEARVVLDAAKAKGVFVMEAMWTRFYPLVKELQKLVHEDKILGDVHRAVCDFALAQNIASLPADSRLKNPALGAGTLLDIGIYCLTWGLLALDSGIGDGAERPQVSAQQHLVDGVDLPAGASEFCRIEGTKGTLVVEGIAASAPNSFTVNLEGQEPKTYEFEKPGFGFYFEADAVALDIAAGRKENATMPWAETIRVMEILDENRANVPPPSRRSSMPAVQGTQNKMRQRAAGVRVLHQDRGRVHPQSAPHARARGADSWLKHPPIFSGPSLRWQSDRVAPGELAIEKDLFEVAGYPATLINSEAILHWPIFEAYLAPTPDPSSSTRRTGRRITRLCRQFLAYVHIKNPVLDVAEFKCYVREATENGIGWDGPSCLVLIACSLGCLGSSDSFAEGPAGPSTPKDDQEIDAAMAYYRAAKKRLGMIESPLLSIQCQFFCGVLEMFLLRPVKAWSYFHQACVLFRNYVWIRRARDAGVAEPRPREIQRLEQRLYWSCMKSECEIRCEIPLPSSGITQFGFPDMLPSPPSGIAPSPPAHPSPETPSSQSRPLAIEPEEEKSWFYYLAEVSFRKMMNRAIATMGASGEQGWISNVHENLTHYKALDEEINIWYSHIPPPSPARPPTTPNELAHFIHHRALACREWIHRPFLYYVLHRAPDDPYMALALPLARECLDMCVRGQFAAYAFRRHHGTWFVARTTAIRALLLLAAAKSGRITLPEGQISATMHYIRFLRPPKIEVQKGQSSLSLVLVLSTDLGDALLASEANVLLNLCLFTQGRNDGHTLEPGFKTTLTWERGARVLKKTVPIPTNSWKQLLIRPADLAVAARQFSQLVSWASSSSATGRPRGLIMPVWFDFELQEESERAGRKDVCLRKLHLVGTTVLEFEEEFGDSIARHVWDGGLAAGMLLDEGPMDIIEIGCGVGVLGVGLCGMLAATRQDAGVGDYRVVMTDISEAEERATGNIRSFLAGAEKAETKTPKIRYENLDWEDGKEGSFSETVGSRAWKLAIISDCTYNTDTIPSLVGTLSKLQESVAVISSQQQQQQQQQLRVFLATKPRHSSELAFFDLMPQYGWDVKEKTLVHLLHTGCVPDPVELYLFERRS
ncbi:unnamed protein product [Parascedosporium putredinis]|uniref:Gfo/Idh/MocA-like oxidoreductase N-terminal domain-containing protein n=1 Tax=Parascedosporium putredinis TaxID=1442378 RepID=A0A9P1GXY3_9PEZI|nr:unnamed protein product [Parascedosporium putredinis]CAI7991120.1 unnamed protein product [Parascedosporium putredinis]